MTPRTTINFFRSRTGGFLLFLILLIIGYFLVNGFKAPNISLTRQREETKTTAEKKAAKPQTVETVTRDMTAFSPPKETPTPAAPAPIPERKPQQQSKPPELPPISLFADTTNAEKPAEPLGEDFAPFGRLVQCELIVTVDSSSINTPIIGLVTDDVWHNGRLIIPAGTEVHGTAKVDRVRERIASSGGWTFVWQTGEELTVSGLALDREKDQDGNGWGITDGSAGLRGQLLKSDDLAEIKLFTASFLSGAASGLTEKEQTVFGTQIVPSLQNAPFVGAQRVLDAYAKQIYDTIQRDGFYVRVPAGKQFYLYVTQTIDKSRAMIGGTRLAAVKTNEQPDSEEASDPLLRLRKNVQRIYSPASEPDAVEFPRRLPASVISPQTDIR
jgi:hypothetical protein